MEPQDQTRAIRGLSRTLKRIRSQHVGKLEVAVGAAILVMLIAGFVSTFFVIGQQLRQAERDRLAAQDRQRIEQIALDVRSALAELRAAIAAAPESQRMALENIQALLEHQTQVIVREQPARETVVVVVTPSPSPKSSPTPSPRCTRSPPLIGRCT